MKERFDPETLKGLSFFDHNTKREMRYIYRNVEYWCAGWIFVKNPNGEWVELRKANKSDINRLKSAIIGVYHDD